MRCILNTILLLICISQAQAVTTIWTKTFPGSEHGSDPDDYGVMVGNDGSVAVLDAYGNGQKVYWYDRSGALIKEFDTVSAVTGFIHVTQHEIVLQGGGTHLYQLDDSEVLEYTALNSNVSLFVSSFSGYSYPYLIDKELVGANQFKLTLYDLTNENFLNIVGDASFGIHGKNLKVRWKTLANASYKVQTTIDLVEWTDYTDIISGTGGTKVIMIPLNETSDQIYARIVKL